MIIIKQYSSITTLLLFVIVAIVFNLMACSRPATKSSEILIGLSTEVLPQLIHQEGPDPENTGISALDDLNARWNVQSMVPLFPDLTAGDETADQYNLSGVYKLIVVLPADTDLTAVVRDYDASPNIGYAEINTEYEIK